VQTIKSRKDFGAVFSSGRRASDRLVRVTALQNTRSDGKLAFVAAKRLGNAVYRNRCKRVLREAARQADLPREDSAIILFATRATHDAHPDEVARSIRRLVGKVIKSH